MARNKPAFITRQIRGGRPTVTRSYKWGPGVPSLAIEFIEKPGESAPKLVEPDFGDVLGTQQLLAITSQDGSMIGITLP